VTLPADRLHELLAARALGDLTGEEQVELDGLLARAPDEDTEIYERTLTALQIALLGQPEPMPESLRERLAMGARDFSETG
jgi:hypothetical protein